MIRGIQGLVAAVLLASGALRAAEPMAFTKVTGEENGTVAIFAKQKEAVLAKRDGKLGSHDWWWWGLNAFDYDRDGDLDLIVGVHGAPFNTHGMLLRNEFKETGKITFTNVSKGSGIEGLVPAADQEPWIWDFDGDGWLDIFGTFNDTPTTCLFNRKGKFEKAASTNFGFAYPVGLADLNADGYLDTWEVTSHGRAELIYDPAGSKFNKRTLPAPELPVLPEALQKELDEIAAFEKNRNPKFSGKWGYKKGMDLNGDGIADQVVTAFASYGVGACLGRYLFADAEGKLTEAEGAGLPDAGTPLFIGDLSGDGADDVLVIASEAAGFYLNDGKGRFTLKPGPLADYLKKKGPYPHRAFVEDLNRDGQLDLVISGRRLENFAVFINGGSGEFFATQKGGAWIDGIAICDINNDGLLDLVVGCQKDKEPRVEVFLNACAQPGHYADLYLRMEKPNWAAVGAKVEVFRAGELGKEGAKPFRIDSARAQGTPVHLGVGDAKTFDARVTFPGSTPKAVELKGLEAQGKITVTPNGAEAGGPADPQ